jgi:hypothetical protein
MRTMKKALIGAVLLASSLALLVAGGGEGSTSPPTAATKLAFTVQPNTTANDYSATSKESVGLGQILKVQLPDDDLDGEGDDD